MANGVRAKCIHAGLVRRRPDPGLGGEVMVSGEVRDGTGLAHWPVRVVWRGVGPRASWGLVLFKRREGADDGRARGRRGQMWAAQCRRGPP